MVTIQLAGDLGVYIDSVVMMRTCISHVLSVRLDLSSIYHPSIKLSTQVTALIHSWLDVAFAGLPACDIQQLQSVLNTAICLVLRSLRRDHIHIASQLHNHHWLPVKQCIEQKLCILNSCGVRLVTANIVYQQ